MIKIIKHGTRDIRECDSCGCLFSFDKEDVDIKEDLLGNHEERIVCPQCNKPVVLKSGRHKGVETWIKK